MAILLFKFIIVNLFVLNQFGFKTFHPTEPTEIKVMSEDSTLSHIYLDVPYIRVSKRHPPGRDCVDEYGMVIEGFTIHDIIDRLEREYDICVKMTHWTRYQEGIRSEITYTRSDGTLRAAGEAYSAIQHDHWLPWQYIKTTKIAGHSGWRDLGCTTGINAFRIRLNTYRCE